jgi:uncharacterized protein (DUF362 family)
MSKENCSHRSLLNRREALKVGAAVVAGGALGLSPDSATAGDGMNAPVKVSGPGHLVKVHMPGMRQGLFPNPKAARTMVDEAVTTLAGETDPGRAWLKFISPADRVGIKVNCLGTRMVSTMREVAFAIADAVRDAGVPDANIVIIDMFASNMMGGRYEVRSNPSKMRIMAHKDHGYQKSWINSGPARLKFSDIFLWTTAIINVPPIKDHDLAGVTCNMKNMTFGVVEKPHVNHNTINESIPHIWALEEIRSRVRLNIIDGSTVLYDGGPKYNPRALVSHECIYATTDPVAMDAYALELIELLRAENGLSTLATVKRPAKYLKLAEEMGIGIATRDRINLQTVELPQFRASQG